MSINKNQNVLITGSAKRVGREIAISLAQQGWNIIIHYHSSAPDDVLAECKSYGVEVASISADLNNFDAPNSIFKQANQQLGEINLLINNASIFEKCKFMDTDEDIFDRHMNINFKAPFFLSQAFAKQCGKNGHILNMCDSFTSRRKTTYFAYLLSKKVFRSFSKMSAAELGPNIRVNAILPGAIQEFSENLDQEFLNKRRKDLPMGNFTSVKDIINVIFYLQNSNLTGQEIFIDGGEQLI